MPVLDRAHGISDDKYLAFCAANPDLRLKRTARGEIVIGPPAGYESDHRNADVTAQLFAWAKKKGGGNVSGSSAGFFLPDGAALSPDAAWISQERLSSVPRAQLRRFPRVVPEFIIEVMSPTDTLRGAQRKMRQWMANGVELAWLIAWDNKRGDNKCVYIYRKGSDPRQVRNADRLAGEGPVEGFVLDLAGIWEGL
ncbi:MAG TPA: Uma2 family endonuclease [Bryobacteraceae bacterium]|nr:Uma2 family endonuclease [Bryobacteraceae bacterium]